MSRKQSLRLKAWHVMATSMLVFMASVGVRFRDIDEMARELKRVASEDPTCQITNQQKEVLLELVFDGNPPQGAGGAEILRESSALDTAGERLSESLSFRDEQPLWVAPFTWFKVGRDFHGTATDFLARGYNTNPRIGSISVVASPNKNFNSSLPVQVVVVGNYSMLPHWVITAFSHDPTHHTQVLAAALDVSPDGTPKWADYNSSPSGSFVLAAPMLPTLAVHPVTGEDGCFRLDGTSFAAPWIANELSVLADAYPSVDPRLVAWVAQFTSTPIESVVHHSHSAAIGRGGVFNPEAAMELLDYMVEHNLGNEPTTSASFTTSATQNKEGIYEISIPSEVDNIDARQVSAHLSITLPASDASDFAIYLEEQGLPLAQVGTRGYLHALIDSLGYLEDSHFRTDNPNGTVTYTLPLNFDTPFHNQDRTLLIQNLPNEAVVELSGTVAGFSSQSPLAHIDSAPYRNRDNEYFRQLTESVRGVTEGGVPADYFSLNFDPKTALPAFVAFASFCISSVQMGFEAKDKLEERRRTRSHHNPRPPKSPRPPKQSPNPPAPRHPRGKGNR